MADQFDAFKKEVEEDLHRERLQKIWEQYGTYIIGAAAALVLAVAGWKFMDNRRQAAAESNAAKYVAALRSLGENKADEGQKALAALGSAPGGYGLLARLRLAAADAAAGQTDKAFVAYDAIAGQSGVDQAIADYARLQSAMLKIDSAEWTETQNRLTPLLAETNPWKHSAREMLGFAAHRAGNLAEARAQFEKLVADPVTPRAISERAGIVMADIAQAEMAQAKAATAPSQPGPATSLPPATTMPAPETPGTKKK